MPFVVCKPCLTDIKTSRLNEQVKRNIERAIGDGSLWYYLVTVGELTGRIYLFHDIILCLELEAFLALF